jgi:CPA2 family monovalent cation:H+ antiporter-2
MITAARQLNPSCRILVRARYLRERAELEQAGADVACFEEAEAAAALAERLLRDLGSDESAIRSEGERIRREFADDL